MQNLWATVKSDIYTSTGTNIILNDEDLIFGIMEKSKFPDIESYIHANYLILIGKLCISKYKYGKSKQLKYLYDKHIDFRKSTDILKL